MRRALLVALLAPALAPSAAALGGFAIDAAGLADGREAAGMVFREWSSRCGHVEVNLVAGGDPWFQMACVRVDRSAVEVDGAGVQLAGAYASPVAPACTPNGAPQAAVRLAGAIQDDVGTWRSIEVAGYARVFC